MKLPSPTDRRCQNTNESLREQLLSVWSGVDEYRQVMKLYMKRLTTDVTEVFGGYLYSMNNKVRSLVEKQRKDFEDCESGPRGYRWLSTEYQLKAKVASTVLFVSRVNN